MRTKFSGILTLLLAFVVQLSFAQEKTISGTVTDNSGIPLPGVNIVIKGTNTGTQSDFDGNYTIQAAKGAVLSYSYLGFAAKEVVVGDGDSINVQLSEDTAQLDEVVVTAQGIRRERKSLGYAVSTIDNEEIEQKSQGDIGRLLRNKAAGVNITSNNGLSGSGTNIIIRGYTSLTGSNQPLFVVDGVPFGSDANEQTAFVDNVTESNRFLDIDPNNIESVNVLKGLSATTLYGNRGRNGVILITTKSGSDNKDGKATLNIAASTFFSNPHLPNYQNEFGNGFNQEFGWFFSNWGPSFSDTDPASYGRYFSSVQNGRVFLTHPFATNASPQFIEGFETLRDSEYEYRPYDSVEDFFRTGIATNLSMSLNGGNSKFSYNVSYGKLSDEGFTPGNKLVRDNISIGGTATHGKLKVSGTLNYSKTDYNTPPIAASRGSGVAGDGASIFSDLIYTPRSVNLTGIPFQRLDGGSLYYRETNGIQHPLWTVNNSKVGQDVNSVFGAISATYSFNDNFNVSYRYGLSTYSENSFYGQNKGGIDGDVTGLYRTTTVVNTVTDHTVTLNYDKDLSDSFNLKAIVGANSNRIEFDRDGIESTGQVVFGVLRHFNFSNQSSTNSFAGTNLQFQQRQNVFGAYADLTLGYNDYLFLNAAVRHDWTSVLEANNNTIVYPSASVSFIPTQAIEGLQSDGWGLNYLKMRFGYGSSAGFPPPYNTRNQLVVNGNQFVDVNGNTLAGNSVSTRIGNPDLKPELVTELEFGIDSRLLDNRWDLNVSVFKKRTEDLITDRNLDPATGGTFTQINAGELETEGIEIDTNFKIVKNPDGLSWDIGGTFYADESEITELPAGVDRLTIGGQFTAADARNGAVLGEPYGVFLGSTVATDDDGNLLVDNAGNYLSTPDTNNVIGDPNPDFISTFNTSVSYKGFTLAGSMTFRKGGDVFSTTTSTLQNRGLIDFPVSRFNTYVLPGINSTTGQPNTVQINATDIAFNNLLFGPANFRVYDGTSLRLNEVSLSYDFPRQTLKALPFSSLSISLSGSNLWYKAFNMPDDANFDPNVNSAGVGNNLGLDFFSGPSAARYGFSVKVQI